MSSSARSLAIAMPIEGTPDTARVCYAVQAELRKLGGVCRLDDPDKFGPGLTSNVDVSRARDRLARVFLEQTDATHLLWWDEDVLPTDLKIIQRMLDTGFDLVGAPYPRKRYPVDYPYIMQSPHGGLVEVEVVNDCVQVEGLAFGFAITSRTCLQSMCDAYPDRWYYDVYQGQPYRTIGIFDLLYSPVQDGPQGAPYRVKFSEDYSFCQSWRAIGGAVNMYIGEYSPCAHIGNHAYHGELPIKWEREPAA